MFIEKRKQGSNVKYYLSHSFRDKNKTKKIRRYIGQNLTEEEINKLRKKAEKHIREQIEQLKTEVFKFSLTPKQIEQLNKYDSKLKIVHLNKKEWMNFKEDFVFNTNAIEGSNVLKNEVKEILQHKSIAKTPDERETVGLSKAVDYINTTNEEISLKLILKLHKLCFKETKSFAGKLRDVEVVIKNSRGEIIHRGAPKEILKYEMKELVDWYKENEKKFKPLVLAALIHNQFEHIHPFQDGNGRVGRLLLNFVLLKNNYPPINIFLEDRQEYYHTLREYSKEGEIKPTLEFLIKQYKKMLREVTTK